MESKRKRDSNFGEGISEMTRQIERLQRDLGRRERELEEERKEAERSMDRIRNLEKDKLELKRELDELRDEVTEYQRVVDELKQDQLKIKNLRKDEEEDERVSSLRSTLQERNRDIEQFIRDLELMENEKEILQDKLKEMSSFLADATNTIKDLTKSREDLHRKLQSTEHQLNQIEEEKSILQIRERELIAFKEQNEQHLENLGNAVEIRVDVWKKMMFQKDEEIERLKSKVDVLVKKQQKATMESGDSQVVQVLKKNILERDEQIRNLMEQLELATEELKQNTSLIKILQSQVSTFDGSIEKAAPEDSANLIASFERKVKKLEGKILKRDVALEEVEKEVEEKMKEVIVLSSKLREYESGKYGLAEAVDEIKELKRQLRVRDDELIKVTQEANQFQIEGSELSEENEMLRKKFGYTEKDDLSSERKHFVKKHNEELNTLNTRVEVLQNEVTTLKTRNYELKKLLSTSSRELPVHPPLQELKVPVQDEVSLKPVSVQDEVLGKRTTIELEDLMKYSPDFWKEKYDIILHENTELRRGLQEILDSLHRLSEEECGNIRLESPILENLLREMSARGLINYPYSISSFHLKVCNLEGKNSQLRDELHRTRLWAEGMLEKEKKRSDEWKDKAKAAEELLKEINLNKSSEFNHKLKDHQLEVNRWKKIGEQSEKMVAMLNEKLEDADFKIAQLEGKLEEQKVQLQSIPKLATLPVKLRTVNVQTEPITREIHQSDDIVHIDIESRLQELQNLLHEKDKLIESMQSLQQSVSTTEFQIGKTFEKPEDSESLRLALESIQSLTERLKAKDVNLEAYKNLLGEARREMQLTSERHIQDITALQSTIHQQQQAFIRMKSTLTNPVRDTPTPDIEEIIREQLTRINELEECIRDLEHTMGNVASQLATARSDSHRWKVTADTRLKEIDLLREQISDGGQLEEIAKLKEKLRSQEAKLNEFRKQADGNAALRKLLDEKERESHKLKGSVPISRSSKQPERASTNDRTEEVERLTKANQELQSKVAKLQVRISKINAVNKATGISDELESLRKEYESVVDQRNKLRLKLDQIEDRNEEEDEKKRKTIDGFARWEEGKKWKKTVERLEAQKREIEDDRNRLNRQLENFRILISRLEKEKSILELRFKKIGTLKSSSSEQNLIGSSNSDNLVIIKLRDEIEQLRSVLGQKDSKSMDEVERLNMEIKILRERIETQERQLTAYEVTQQSDPKVVSEIEKLVKDERRLQQDLIRVEQENLELKLQLQEMKLETPRLRERVSHLQRLVEVLKLERSSGGTMRGGTSTKNLGELERTISALKGVIDKLQHETKEHGSGLRASKSLQNLRSRHNTLMDERQSLLDKIQYLEEERSKAQKLQIELEIRIGDMVQQRDNALLRAKSAEMKLKVFLDHQNPDKGPEAGEERSSTAASNASEIRIKKLEEEIERKSQLLSDAKKTIEEITKTKPKLKNRM